MKPVIKLIELTMREAIEKAELIYELSIYKSIIEIRASDVEIVNAFPIEEEVHVICPDNRLGYVVLATIDLTKPGCLATLKRVVYRWAIICIQRAPGVYERTKAVV